MTREQVINVWIIFNAATLFFFIAAWPISALTFFRTEPQGILGLSYLALIIGAMGNLIAVLILRQVDPEVDAGAPSTVGNSQRANEEGASGN